MTVADSDFHALWMQNLDYPARLDRVFADNIWTEGILGATSFAVSPSSPAAMTVDVAAGVAVVEGDDQTAQGKYLVRKQTSEDDLVIGAAPGSGQRNDLVVLQVRDPNAGGAAGDDAVITVIAGTPSGSGTDPAVPDTALVLARVRVPAGTGSITAGLIDDLRVGADPEHDALSVPAGTIVDTLRDTAPSGWVLMQGQTLTNAQTVYPRLWDALPATFKSGSDILLPDMRGRVTLGAGTGSGLSARTLGATGGAETHTLTTSEMPSHTHTINHGHTASQTSHSHQVNSHTHTIPDHTHPINHGHSNNIAVSTSGAHSHSVNLLNAGSFTGNITGATGGTVTATFTTDPAQGSHSHTLTGGVTNHTGNSGGSGVLSSGGDSPGTNSQTPAVTVASHSGSSGSAGSGSAHNIMQPFVVTNKMIRVR